LHRELEPGVPQRGERRFGVRGGVGEIEEAKQGKFLTVSVLL